MIGAKILNPGWMPRQRDEIQVEESPLRGKEPLPKSRDLCLRWGGGEICLHVLPANLRIQPWCGQPTQALWLKQRMKLYNLTIVYLILRDHCFTKSFCCVGKLTDGWIWTQLWRPFHNCGDCIVGWSTLLLRSPVIRLRIPTCKYEYMLLCKGWNWFHERSFTRDCISTLSFPLCYLFSKL